MGMQKIDFIRRAPGIGDYNLLVETVNKIIDRLNTKLEIVEVKIERIVKDFKFFKGEEVRLPYHNEHTLVDNEDATNIFDQYNFTYKELAQINDLIIKGKIVKLIIDVIEEVTEKEVKQEMMFESTETILLKPNKKEKKNKVGQTTTKTKGRKKKVK